VWVFSLISTVSFSIEHNFKVELRDIRDFDLAIKKIEYGEDALVPTEVVYRILDDVHPVRVWRQYRDTTLHELTLQCKVSDVALSQIETENVTRQLNCSGAWLKHWRPILVIWLFKNLRNNGKLDSLDYLFIRLLFV